MASKIHTDNPKHHKYVSVNKRERKKQTLMVRLLSLFFPKWMFEPGCSGRYCYPADYRMDNAYRTKVIYDDCNHKSFRIMRKTKDGWKVVGDSYKTIQQKRGWITKYKTHIMMFRQSIMDYETRVKHFICN